MCGGGRISKDVRYVYAPCSQWPHVFRNVLLGLPFLSWVMLSVFRAVQVPLLDFFLVLVM